MRRAAARTGRRLAVHRLPGLFERLAGAPATLDELATKCGVPRRTLGISIDAMASLGLVERDGECYRNSAAAAAFLAGTPGPDLRPMPRFLDQISYGLWMSRFQSDRGVVGRSVTVNGHACLVIGVMPPGFVEPREETAEVWTSIALYMEGATPPAKIRDDSEIPGRRSCSTAGSRWSRCR